jgi:hypothetical protein
MIQEGDQKETKLMNRRQEIDRRLTAEAIDTLRREPARVAKLTELLLTGDSWRMVRETMLLSHDEFMELLGAAVYKAHVEAMQDPEVGRLGPFDWPRNAVEPATASG